jgi:hypothetical protein
VAFASTSQDEDKYNVSNGIDATPVAELAATIRGDMDFSPGIAAIISDENKSNVSNGIDATSVVELAATIRGDKESNFSNGIAPIITDDKESNVSNGIDEKPSNILHSIDATPVAELDATIKEDLKYDISNGVQLHLVVDISANITNAFEPPNSDANKVTLAAKSIPPLLHDHSDIQMQILSVTSIPPLLHDHSDIQMQILGVASQGDTVNILSRPRDRDFSSDLTLVGGSDSKLAGQASAFEIAPNTDGALTHGTHHTQAESVDINAARLNAIFERIASELNSIYVGLINVNTNALDPATMTASELIAYLQSAELGTTSSADPVTIESSPAVMLVSALLRQAPRPLACESQTREHGSVHVIGSNEHDRYSTN